MQPIRYHLRLHLDNVSALEFEYCPATKSLRLYEAMKLYNTSITRITIVNHIFLILNLNDISFSVDLFITALN